MVLAVIIALVSFAERDQKQGRNANQGTIFEDLEIHTNRLDLVLYSSSKGQLAPILDQDLTDNLIST